MSGTREETPRMLTEEMRSTIRRIAARYPSPRAATLPALHLVHETYRCVPVESMREIGEVLGIAPAEVQDTMSFYGFFSQAPIGRKRVWVCRSISCALRGGEEILSDTCEKLGIHPGETTADGSLTVEFAECLGLCDFAPAALADDGRFFGPLESPKSVDELLDAVRSN
jgi:NADH-quinone oxidoreductase subunit E